jgi:hypothetical protein
MKTPGLTAAATLRDVPTKSHSLGLPDRPADWCRYLTDLFRRHEPHRTPDPPEE